MHASKQSGFTLLELLLVIGVAALLLIGSIVTYRIITEGSKSTNAIRKLLTIKQEAGLLGQQQNQIYTGIAYNSASGAGAADGGNSPLVTNGTLMMNERNPFNGAIIVGPDGAGDINMSITFENVSQPGCIRLIQAIPAPAEIVSVGTATATYTSAADQIPVTATDASSACNQVSNNVTWIMP
jgi:prepilin-type N-terminal cleavage/methylation domain-containing protein